MTVSSNNKGRAYEYAWLNVLYDSLKAKRNATIVKNSSFYANKRAWDLMDPGMQKLFEISASAAINTVFELEPLIIENSTDPVILEPKKDKAGVQGDVRDIVIKRNSIQWEIGLSIKHNHEAIKHSRLSHRLDFGKEWFNHPCSESYWNDVRPIFNRLIKDKQDNRKWNELSDKEHSVYVPLLNAFINEVKRSYSSDFGIARKMVEYLIGTEDYYKIVSQDSKQITLIHSFNVHGTLNKPSQAKVSAITVPIVNLPTEIVEVRFKPGSSNTIEMYLNNGWQLSFRIHNAKTEVEPSLKFDIQFIGMPITILTIECRWNR